MSTCDSVCGVQYRIHSTKVKCRGWYPTKAEAIAAFERGCKRVGIAPPLHYPPSVSGDSITNSNIAYLRSMWATEVREGHGWVYFEARNDFTGRT